MVQITTRGALVGAPLRGLLAAVLKLFKVLQVFHVYTRGGEAEGAGFLQPGGNHSVAGRAK